MQNKYKINVQMFDYAIKNQLWNKKKCMYSKETVEKPY